MGLTNDHRKAWAHLDIELVGGWVEVPIDRITPRLREADSHLGGGRFEDVAATGRSTKKHDGDVREDAPGLHGKSDCMESPRL